MRSAALWRRLWPYALVLWLFLATSPYHRGLNNPNEMVRVYMSVAAVEDGTFAIDPVIRRWGMVDDKAVREGRLYSSKAPLQSLVGVPAYLVAKPLLEGLGLPVDARHVTHVLRILGSALFGSLLAFALVAWCRSRAEALGAERSTGTALGLVLALGTMIYPYALTFTGHVLAAATAGGCFLAVAKLEREAPGTARWRAFALLAGFLGGATPFAEYPAALVALPALTAALVITPGVRGRLALVGWLAAGGILPFGLGLWSHDVLWGSPLATGYGFLENPGYVEVHEKGFFGVTLPKAKAFLGTLFSPGTGLFFFSPVLALGLLPIFRRAILGRGKTTPSEGYGRAICLAALCGIALELLFISGHKGWRGGWTLGPRYIIAVVVLLGFGCAEALGHRRLRPWLMGLGAASILLTGPAAALYPHLSDVYTNPLRSFLVPTYLRGETTYGVGHALGFEGHLANLFHLLPLGFAALYVALAGWQREGLGRRLAVLGMAIGGAALVVGLVPEDRPPDARRENRRLWGFWEPAAEARPGQKAEIVVHGPGEGFLGTARGRWKAIRVRRLPPEGPPRPCTPEGAPCTYGDASWHRFGPDGLKMEDRRRSALFMHPIAKEKVEATIPLPRGAQAATLRYGLTDASMASDNPHPVTLTVTQGGEILGVAQAGAEWGYRRLPLTLSSTTAPLVVTAEVERDGARVLGFDVEFYDRP